MKAAKNQIVSACLSDVGRVRTNNEDACGAFPKSGVWCVADGMGGGDDGEVASAETVASVAAFAAASDSRDLGAEDAVAAVRAAVSAASRRIFDRAREKGLSCCGSTFVGLVLGRERDGPAHALHAGDSRLYRIRGGVVRRITRDHSVLESAGVRSEAELNPMLRNVILRAVGVERDVALDDTPFDCRPGDRVLLCSDGLTRMVPDAEFACRTDGLTAAAAARALVDAANAAGGEDNVTVVVVDVLRPRRYGPRLLFATVLLAVLSIVALVVLWCRLRVREPSETPSDEEDPLLRAARQMEQEAGARMETASKERDFK